MLHLVTFITFTPIFTFLQSSSKCLRLLVNRKSLIADSRAAEVEVYCLGCAGYRPGGPCHGTHTVCRGLERESSSILRGTALDAGFCDGQQGAQGALPSPLTVCHAAQGRLLIGFQQEWPKGSGECSDETGWDRALCTQRLDGTRCLSSRI